MTNSICDDASGKDVCSHFLESEDYAGGETEVLLDRGRAERLVILELLDSQVISFQGFRLLAVGWKQPLTSSLPVAPMITRMQMVF